MLGQMITVRVDHPLGSYNTEQGYQYALNCGTVIGGLSKTDAIAEVYIMGIQHPVREFEGRLIATIKRKGDSKLRLIAAPKSRRYIVNEIHDAIAFSEQFCDYSLRCYYEKSCGAVIFTHKDEKTLFLLVKNKRSTHWGFPKGHMEEGETELDTALREVWEETGLTVDLMEDFAATSEYSIQSRVEKTVKIFLAYSEDPKLKIQQEEIDDAVWLPYEGALHQLKFENDRSILKKAHRFLLKKHYI